MAIIDQLDVVLCFGSKMQGKSTLADQLLQYVPPRKRCIYDFTGFFSKYQDPQKSLYYYRVKYGAVWEAQTFMEIVYDLGNCFTVFDEADLYFKSDNDMLETFLVTDRNRLGGAFVICKRPFAITPQARAQLNKIISFNQKLPNDIQYMSKLTGQPYEMLIKILPFLAPGQHVVFDMDLHEMSGVIRYPLKS